MSLDLRAPVDELAAALCDIVSVSGGERELADAIQASLADARHLAVTRDGDAVVARTDTGRSRRVVIAGHLDTVPVNGNLPSRRVSAEDGEWLWGRGTVDMKASVALQLRLAAELAEPSCDVTWIWYDNEEVEASRNGLGRLARNHPEFFAADFAILGEPSNGLVEGGCNGTLRVAVTARGVRAHSARAWAGVNAIHAAAPVLAVLAAYRPREVEVEGLTYREGVNAVGISGGVAGNVIPDECTVLVNYRFAPSVTGAQAVNHLGDLFDGFQVDVLDLAEGARPGLESPAAREFLDAVGVAAAPKYGWTDVARFSALGIPAVNYGPGDPTLAHADDERVPLAQLFDVEARLRRWLTGPGPR